MRIVYVEDEPRGARLARQWLAEEGHAVRACGRGDAIATLEENAFDLAILDWTVGDDSGQQALRWIRTNHPSMPVLFATSQAEGHEIVNILGVDADFLVKPLRRPELLARVNALARSAGAVKRRAAMDIGPYRVDATARRVMLHGQPVKMTPRMTELALMMFAKRGELVSRSELYRQVWGHRQALQTRSVDTHVSRVRSALELDGRHGWKLVSVYQQGYRLEES